MVIKTRIPHRIMMKNGVVKTYNPGYVLTNKDKALYDAIKFHRLYRRDIYMAKMENSFIPESEMTDEPSTMETPVIHHPATPAQPVEQKGLVNEAESRETTTHPSKEAEPTEINEAEVEQPKEETAQPDSKIEE